MDWFARRIPALRLSNNMEASFCIDAVEAALTQYGSPQIFNTDQGSQFTSAERRTLLANHQVRGGLSARLRSVRRSPAIDRPLPCLLQRATASASDRNWD